MVYLLFKSLLLQKYITLVDRWVPYGWLCDSCTAVGGDIATYLRKQTPSFKGKFPIFKHGSNATLVRDKCWMHIGTKLTLGHS